MPAKDKSEDKESSKQAFPVDKTGDRPMSQDPRVKVFRELGSSLNEPTYLGNSMSDGMYERANPRFTYSSLSDPMDGFLQNSLSGDSNYQLPAALQSRRGLRGQGILAARSRPTMQRIVVRTSIHDVEYLGNSYSDAEYTPQRR